MNSHSVVSFLTIAFVLGLTPLAPGQISERGVSRVSDQEHQNDARTISEAEQAVFSDAAVPETAPSFSEEAPSRSFMPERLPSKENYVMSIELAHLSWPGEFDRAGDKLGGRLAIGFNRPYYNIKDELRVIGNFDLKLDGIVIGFKNTARITFKYDLSRSITNPKTRFELFCENIVFKVGIPFGGRR